MTSSDRINLTVSWERQENRETRCEIDHQTPKKQESIDCGGKGADLYTRH